MFEIHKNKMEDFLLRLIAIIIMLFCFALGSNISAQDIQDIDSINLYLDLKFPKYSEMPHPEPWKQFILNDLTSIPGAYQVEYIGINGLIFGQIKQRVRGQIRDNIHREFHENTMSIGEFNRRMNQTDVELNPHGDWWERSWMDSFPPENGGAPKGVYIHEIGWEIKIPRGLPILWWFKKKFDALGDIWIDADQEFNDIENADRLDNPSSHYAPPDKTASRYERLERTPRPDIEISGQDYRWYEGSRYHVRFKPTVRFKPSEGHNRIVDEVAVRVMVELYNRNHDHWANVIFFVRHGIPNDQTHFSVQLQFINW